MPEARSRFWTRMAATMLLSVTAFWLPGPTQALNPKVKAAPDFTLMDQHGHAFVLSQHRGRPIVLFFGYTHCPDVCPTILASLERAREIGGSPARDVLVALITVDAQRDTPAELRQFVGVFDPTFLGLTGTSSQLKTVYRAYHVRIEKQIGNASGYLVAHTAFVYYIGRDGRLRGFGTWDDPPSVVEQDVREIARSNR